MLTLLEKEAVVVLDQVLDYLAAGRSKTKAEYLDVMGAVRDCLKHLTNKQFGCYTGQHSTECNCKRGGFTLIEMMMVVVIIAILASVSVAKIDTLIRKSQEARTKGNLATLRAAVTVHTLETGSAPTALEEVVSGPFATLRQIPYKFTPPYHAEGNTVTNGPTMGLPGSVGSWFYFNDPTQPEFGHIVVNCVHSDLKGQVWSSL